MINPTDFPEERCNRLSPHALPQDSAFPTSTSQGAQKAARGGQVRCAAPRGGNTELPSPIRKAAGFVELPFPPVVL